MYLYNFVSDDIANKYTILQYNKGMIVFVLECCIVVRLTKYAIPGRTLADKTIQEEVGIVYL